MGKNELDLELVNEAMKNLASVADSVYKQYALQISKSIEICSNILLKTEINNIIKINSAIIKYIEINLNNHNEIFEQYIEIFNNLNRKNLEYNLNKYNNIFKQYIESINDIDIDNLKLNSNGTLEYENKILDIKENEIKSVIDNIKKGENFDDNLKQNKSDLYIKKVIIFIVLSILSGLFNKCGESIYELIPKSYNAYISQDKSNNKEKFLKKFRIVNAKELNVREAASSNNKIIGKLYMYQCVEVLEKVKYWTKIKYIDKEKDISIEGWVYSRYLLQIDDEKSVLIEGE